MCKKKLAYVVQNLLSREFQPDLFFAVDCSPADDTVTKNGTFGHLGEGTLMRIYDPGMIMLPRMKEFLLDTARNKQYPLPILCV